MIHGAAVVVVVVVVVSANGLVCFCGFLFNVKADVPYSATPFLI